MHVAFYIHSLNPRIHQRSKVRIASRKASWHPCAVQTYEIEHQKMMFYPKHVLALSRPNLLKSQDWMGSAPMLFYAVHWKVRPYSLSHRTEKCWRLEKKTWVSCKILLYYFAFLLQTLSVLLNISSLTEINAWEIFQYPWHYVECK